MKVQFFDTHEFEKSYFTEAAQPHGIQFEFFKTHLDTQTAHLSDGSPICVFVNDQIDQNCLTILKSKGVKFIALRCAGYNNIDLKKARELGIKIVRVPEYSPHAVAEHAVGLLLSLVRKLPKAISRTKELNFSLDGLVGFDLYKKNVAVIGFGKIGRVFSQIMQGFGCQVMVVDPSVSAQETQSKSIKLTTLEDAVGSADIISLHCPLNDSTRHIINTETIKKMKDGVILINTGRGSLIETQALIKGLKIRKIGGAALDVYEEESGIFFENLSDQLLTDDLLARLLTFPNVHITSHQGFLTQEALFEIAKTTTENLNRFQKNQELRFEIT